MTFHTYGETGAPVMLLIHGVLTPWQIFEQQIAHYKDSFRVIAVALDAHEEEQASEFSSTASQAEKIEDYIMDGYDGEVFAVAGLSMGGVIACTLWANGVIGIKKLILDGAPLLPVPSLVIGMMTNSYLKIIEKSKQRDPKTLENFKKYFLPEKHLESFLKIADNMSEKSVRNVVNSASSYKFPENVESSTEILLLHGTKGKEKFNARSLKKFRKQYPHAKEYCFNGTDHIETAIYHPEKWVEQVDGFLMS